MENQNIDEEKLKKLAHIAVKVGLNLQNGQDLLITASIESLPLVRKIVDVSYKSGAGLVTTFFSDDELILSRYKNANDSSFDCSPSWLYEGIGKAFENNTARLAIVGDDPLLLAQEDPKKVSRLNKANSIAYKPAREKITNFEINWSIVSWPGLKWSQRVFPDLSGLEAQSKLSEAIFSASRINDLDPVDSWRKHNKNLKDKYDWLNNQNFEFLDYKGPNTDLRVGLADNHEWMGGASMARNGVICNPNIPSEEVFTTPHMYKVDGIVSSTKPLSHNGTLIEDIRVKFKKGKITEAKTSRGQNVFEKLLDTDEGARRLGEIALVPNSSPISASGLLFYNTLFDENAACHIALGQCYSKCFKNSDKNTEKDIKSFGGNSSMIHVDWMIGSNEIDIDGIKRDGIVVPIFRKGEWVRN